MKTKMRDVMLLATLVILTGGQSIIAASPVGKLLVRSYNGSNWDLYLMNEDGSNLSPIDNGPANTYQGVISPDGQFILYTSENGSVFDLYLIQITGGSPSLIAAGLMNESHVAWGDTKDHFFYQNTTGGNCGYYDRQIRIRALDGSSDQLVLSAKNVSFNDVRKDLNKMLCADVIPAVCDSRYGVIVTYNADGTNRYVLPSTTDGKSDNPGRISPDGEWIIYVKSDTGWSDPHNIYMMRWDGTQVEKLTNYTSQAANPCWRDDDTIFYSVATNMYSTNYVLHKFTISTGADVVIPNGLPNCSPVDFLMSIEQTPADQIEEILDYVYDSVGDGTLVGVGGGKSDENRLVAVMHMLEEAWVFIEAEWYHQACHQLRDVLKKCDGQSPPPDTVTGSAAEELADMINDLMDEICEPSMFAPVEVMAWVPYFYEEHVPAGKTFRYLVEESFSGDGPKDGLTRVGLQFWVPTTDGHIVYKSGLSNGNIAEWREWCHINGRNRN